MISAASYGVLVMAGYLLWLGWMSVFRRNWTVVFLESFASSAKAHFIEMGLRILAGTTLLVAAPSLVFRELFYTIGIVLIVTSVVLALIPWRWHRRFARKVIPGVISQLPVFGMSSFLLGMALLGCVLIPVFSG